MSDLAEFLAARLDEDEAAAKDERVWFGPYPETIGEFEGHLVIQADRVLREVEAGRAILAEYAKAEERWQKYHEDECATELEACVLALAAVYRDHPAYDPAWVPDAK